MEVAVVYSGHSTSNLFWGLFAVLEASATLMPGCPFTIATTVKKATRPSEEVACNDIWYVPAAV